MIFLSHFREFSLRFWYFLPYSRVLTLNFISGLDTSVHHRQGPLRHPVRVHRQHSRARSRLTRWPDAWLHSCLLQWYGRRGSTYALKDQTTPLSPNWPKSWILVSQPPKLLRCVLLNKGLSQWISLPKLLSCNSVKKTKLREYCWFCQMWIRN